MFIDLESGSFCLKYRNFISNKIVKNCKMARQKGCAGGGCKYLTSATKINEKIRCPLEGTNRNLEDCPYWREPSEDKLKHEPSLLCEWQDLEGFCCYE